MTDRLHIAKDLLASMLVVNELRESRGKPRQKVDEMCREAFKVTDRLIKFETSREPKMEAEFCSANTEKPIYLRPIQWH